MKAFDYVCEGQMNLFDILKPAEKEVPILLRKEQIVYHVVLGDVHEAVVGRTYTYGENNRGYHLENYGCTHNDRIGVDCFTDREDADKLAEKNRRSLDCILAKDIEIKSVKAFQYVRKVDNRTMTSFIADIGNDTAYVKEFMTFHHIIQGFDKAMKGFMKQQEFKYVDAVEVELNPEIKNMYRCVGSDWLYAECGYSGCIGVKYL